MRITVAGTGYVGLVTGVCLAELGHEVTCIDIESSKIELLKSGTSPIYEPGLEDLLKKNLKAERLHFTTNSKEAYAFAEIIFIAVGTPENLDGTANLSFIMDAAETIACHINTDVIICTKSTVPVGTNERINALIQSRKPANLQAEVVSNPEFLREGSAIIDFFHGDRIVIGADQEAAAAAIEQLYSPLCIPIIKTDVKSAEMIKYASNAFLATKISFINEIAALCEKLGANIDEVSYAIGKDHRIGSHFLQAGIGYGGSCFPKDTKALVQIAGNMQHSFELLEAVIKVNNRQQSLPVMKAKEMLGSLKGKKIALLGLAFKPHTDDVREAASIVIIKELLSEGAIITAYDPIAIHSARSVIGSSINYSTSIKGALMEAEAAIIATEWEQIKQLPLDEYVQNMKSPIVIDGRNCYSIEDTVLYPIKYISVGRPVTDSLFTKSF